MIHYRDELEKLTTEELADKALEKGFMPPAEGDAREYYIDCLVRALEAEKNPMSHEPEDMSG